MISRLLSLHRNRGPDCSKNTWEHLTVGESPSKVDVRISGHVLWTQGRHPVPQPYVNSTGTRMCLFNGDIYSFEGSNNYNVDHFQPQEIHDGLSFFEKIQDVLDSENCVDQFASLVGRLRGPFAFILVDKVTETVMFGRDFFGRESLLLSYDDAQQLIVLSSVSVFSKVFEIPTAGIYQLDLKTWKLKVLRFSCHERVDVLENLRKFGDFLESIGVQQDFEFNFRNEICLSFSTHLKVSDSQSCSILQQLSELSTNTHLDRSQLLIRALYILDSYVSELLKYLRQSVRLRMKAVAPTCRKCTFNSSNPSSCSNHSTIGILFSGGLDSTVLAYLAAEASTCTNQPIELINVAFSKDSHFDHCPDRQTGIESYEVLRKIFEPQGKSIKLVLVNESKEEVKEMREDRIKNLIRPLTSVLDDSLGCCLWFATRGRRRISLKSQDANRAREDSLVKTVFLGSGADELFGGYGRHRSAYERQGWEGLAKEMQLDLDRISIRNMGRDNRVVSDHGVCPRMPFLDEAVVNFVASECDLWIKCCPLLGDRGLGEKLLLRVTALRLLGEENAKIALFPKRAMQFGSRIAKLENSKEKGGDSCDRLRQE